MTKIEIPLGIQKISRVPNYMMNGIVQSAGTDKMVGITVTNAQATVQDHWDFGVTHFANLVADQLTPSPSFSQRWANYRSQGFATPTDFANSVALNKYHGYGGQLQEDGFNEEMAMEGFGRVYDRLVANDPSITSPADTWIIGDYFQPLPGGRLLGADAAMIQKHRDNLASQATCRLKFDFGENNFLGQDLFYNSAWGYAKQNGQIPANYLNSWAEYRGGLHPYQLLFDMNKSRGGCTGRRLLSFDWTSHDNAEWGYVRTKNRIKYDSPAGDLHVLAQWNPIPYEIMKQRAFFYLLLGEGFVLWEVAFTYTNDVTRWNDPLDPNSTQWQADGGSLETYNDGNAAHPNRPPQTQSPVFPDYALGVGENGAAAGIYMYCELKKRGRVGNFVEWTPFTYTVDGGPVQNGYAGGSTPVNGLNGNARLSSRMVPNYGEVNVLNSLEAAKPLVQRTNGPDGDGFVAINPHADPDQTTVITLPTHGNKTLVLYGDELATFYF